MAADAREFLSALVASAAPSLDDFYRFYSHHDESEVEFELRHCREQWNEGLIETSDGHPDLEPKCKKFVRARAADPRSVQSLYLAAVRAHLGLPGAEFEVGRVSRIPGGDPNRAFVVEATVGSHKVQLYHAANASLAQLGLVGLLKVDGKPAAETISPTRP